MKHIQTSKLFANRLSFRLVKHFSNLQTINNIPFLTPTDKLGNLTDIGKSGSLHDFLVDQHKKLGDTFGFYWEDKPIISMGNPHQWKKIAKLYNRPPMAIDLFKPLIGDNAIQFVNDQEFLERKKRYVDPSFSAQQLKSAHFNALTKVLNDSAIPRWEEAAKTGEFLSLYDYCVHIATRTISVVAFGDKLSEEELLLAQKNYLEAWVEMDKRIRGIYPDESTEEGKKRIENLEVNVNFFKNMVTKIMDNYKPIPGQENGFIDFLFKEKDRDLISCEILSFFIGGAHTTGSMLFWTFFYLMKNPEFIPPLRDEAIELLRDKDYSPDNINKFKICKSVLHESLRLARLVTFVARYSNEDLELDENTKIEKGTYIITPYGKVFHDENLWKDPSRFNPNRFKEDGVQTPYQFYPFGFAGGRVCPGRNLAMYEGTLFISAFFKDYKMSIKEGEKDPGYANGLLTYPSHDIEVKIAKI